MALSIEGTTMAAQNSEMSRRPPRPARDLADFHLRWSEFRPLAVEAKNSPEMSDPQRETLTWLIALSDRIGEGDLR
jgi:hypothetical protein